MIEDKVFYLCKTDFCAAATEALDGAVTVTTAGGLAVGVFSKKPSALLLAGVDPKETMPICQKAACRMVIPNTSIHAWVIQGKSQEEEGFRRNSRWISDVGIWPGDLIVLGTGTATWQVSRPLSN